MIVLNCSQRERGRAPLCGLVSGSLIKNDELLCVCVFQVGNGSGSPYKYPNLTAGYIVKWIKGAKTQYDLDIDYVGVSATFSTGYVVNSGWHIISFPNFLDLEREEL